MAFRACLEAAAADAAARQLRKSRPRPGDDDDDAIQELDGSSVETAMPVGTPTKVSRSATSNVLPIAEVRNLSRKSVGIETDVEMPEDFITLTMREPWHGLLLDGTKTWEIRSSACPQESGTTGPRRRYCALVRHAYVCCLSLHSFYSIRQRWSSTPRTVYRCGPVPVLDRPAV